MQDTASPKQPSTGETELTVSQPLRRALLLSFSTSNTLSPGCFAETLYRSFRRRRWCTGGAAKGVSTLCKRSACDADVLESNERREILFSADHSAGRPYILVPYWSIAMHTGARILYRPDLRTGKRKSPVSRKRLGVVMCLDNSGKRHIEPRGQSQQYAILVQYGGGQGFLPVLSRAQRLFWKT